MKLRILYLLPFFSVCFLMMNGCSGTKTSAPTPNIPSGTFSGPFYLYHLHEKTGLIDTMTANVNLTINKTGFAVTGDTATLHAGSYGGYIVNSTFTAIDFVDKTYPTTGTPTKVHLNGVYEYTFNGTSLQMEATSPFDTLQYYYNLNRTSN